MSFVSNSRSTRRRLASDRSGTATLEMALVLPILILFIIGTMEVGRYYFTLQALRTLTAEAARMAIIAPSMVSASGCTFGNADTFTADSVRVTAATKVPFLSSSGTDLGLCILRTADSTGRITIVVTARYPFTSFLPRTSFLTSNIFDSTTLVYREN